MNINLLGISQNDIFNLTSIITQNDFTECYNEFFDTNKYFVVR